MAYTLFRSQPVESLVFLLAFSLTIACYFAHEWLSSAEPSDPIISVSDTLDLTGHLLGEEEKPHPVGSHENKAVKQRILEWLATNSIRHNPQTDWGCSESWGNCARVENIIATVPGETDGPALAFMAHYDSVPPAPGAGDNMVAVAALLQITKELQSRKHRNPIILVITDGEERGLTGAEAFFTKHPLRDRIGALINLEGAVGTGPLLLFRTSGNSKELIRLYGEHATSPQGSSLYSEVFKYMAANTDFAVPLRYGITGVDFAKAGDISWKHTQDDKLANLDAPSLQLMLDNVAGLAFGLANLDLTSLESGSSSYLSVYGLWLNYDANLNYLWLGLSLAMLIALSLQHDWRSVLRVSFGPLLYFFACFFALAATFLILHFLNGDTPFHPAHKFPFRMLLFAVPGLLALTFALRANQNRSCEQTLLGAWWFMWVVASLFVSFFLAASVVVVLPTLLACLLMSVARFTGRKTAMVIWLASLILCVPVFLNLVLLVELTQGYWFVPATAICFTLFYAASVAFVRGPLLPIARYTTVAVVLMGMALATYLPLYTPEKPQTMIYRLVQNADTRQAWLEFVSLNALPESIARVEPFADEVQIYPWDEGVESVAVQQPLSEPSPRLTLIDRDTERVTVEVQSIRRGLELGFVFPGNADLSAISIDGHTYQIKPREYGSWPGNFVVSLNGLYGDPVQITLHTKSATPLKGWLYDVKQGLPTQYDFLMQARTPLAVEVHGGDRSLLYKGVSL